MLQAKGIPGAGIRLYLYRIRKQLRLTNLQDNLHLQVPAITWSGCAHLHVMSGVKTTYNVHQTLLAILTLVQVPSLADTGVLTSLIWDKLMSLRLTKWWRENARVTSYQSNNCYWIICHSQWAHFCGYSSASVFPSLQTWACQGSTCSFRSPVIYTLYNFHNVYASLQMYNWQKVIIIFDGMHMEKLC